MGCATDASGAMDARRGPRRRATSEARQTFRERVQAEGSVGEEPGSHARHDAIAALSIESKGLRRRLQDPREALLKLVARAVEPDPDRFFGDSERVRSL